MRFTGSVYPACMRSGAPSTTATGVGSAWEGMGEKMATTMQGKYSLELEFAVLFEALDVPAPLALEVLPRPRA